jgi:AraC-like DNA-binding protein
VGYQLGFNNPSHFSRVFKQSFGAAPKTVAKQGN